MKIITEAKFVGDGIVSAKFDGKEFSFNNVLSNDHYAAIVEAGITPTPYTVPAADWLSVRAERDQLLKDTDWQASSDRTMSDAEASYRQALRDLPSTNSDPTQIVFPDAP